MPCSVAFSRRRLRSIVFLSMLGPVRRVFTGESLLFLRNSSPTQHYTLELSDLTRSFA